MFDITKMQNCANKLYRWKLKWMAKFICRSMLLMFSCDIPYTAEIDKTVEFTHKAIGVVIGHDTIMRAHVKVGANVVIGGRSGVRGNPVIGEYTVIGAGAIILGPVNIGKNVQIGAGAVVITDVPDGCTAVGVPARVIHKGNSKDA